jgi:hypothetical protein
MWKNVASSPEGFESTSSPRQEFVSYWLNRSNLIISKFSLSQSGATFWNKALHGVISQKKILFKTTAVKTSNPTKLSSFEN